MRYSAVVIAVAGCRGDFNSLLDADPGVMHDAAHDAAHDTAGVPSGLVGSWTFDEGAGGIAHDSVSQANASLVAGGASDLPLWTTGHEGTALAFAGDGDRAQVGLVFSNIAQVTVAAWIFPTATLTGPDQCVVDKGSPSQGWGFDLDLTNDGDLAFFARATTATVLRETVAGVISTGQWSHVVLTWDGSLAASGVHFYVNGVEPSLSISQDGAGTRPDDSTVPFAINCVSTAGMAGTIDDVQVFDRALTAAEVASL